MSESRRSVLKRLGVVAGGLVGLLAGREALASSKTGRNAAVVAPPGVETVVLEGRGWHIYSKDLAKGQIPTGGDRLLVYGDLHEAGSDSPAGQFFATYYSLRRPGFAGPLASLEQHTFNLPDGSIMGSGTTKAGFATEDEFAIVGGTGRYAGARGTYVVRQSHQELGGDGTATIVFTMFTEGAV
jgi:hypothetical protein